LVAFDNENLEAAISANCKALSVEADGYAELKTRGVSPRASSKA
jgi:hypothetical protein